MLFQTDAYLKWRKSLSNIIQATIIFRFASIRVIMTGLFQFFIINCATAFSSPSMDSSNMGNIRPMAEMVGV
jgi:hypothetical protein